MEPSRVSKLLRDARAEIARPTRPETPRDRRLFGSSRGLLDLVRSDPASNPATASTPSSSTAVAAHHLSGLPVVMTKLPPLASSGGSSSATGTIINNNNNNGIIGGNNNSANSLPAPVANAAQMQTRTATANSSGLASSSTSSTQQPSASTTMMTMMTSSSGSITVPFAVRPPVRPPAHPQQQRSKSPSHQHQQQQQQGSAEIHATESKLRRGSLRNRKNSSCGASSSSECNSAAGSDADENEHAALTATAGPAIISAEQHNKFKQLILSLDASSCSHVVRAKAAADILALLQWGGGESVSQETHEDDETKKLRTRALEVALELFRGSNNEGGDHNDDNSNDEQQQQQQPATGEVDDQKSPSMPSWLAARNANLIDTALRFVECRPFGSVDFTVAISCVKTAAEIPDCLSQVFTAGGIRVLKSCVLDAALKRVSAAQQLSPIISLCVAMALQTLSFLSEMYSAHLVRSGVCEPCCDLAPFLDDDDRAASALCSLAAKLLTARTSGTYSEQQSAVVQWRSLRHGVFGQRLARCVQKRWMRMRGGTAKVTGCTLVARGLLAVAMLIADGGTPLDVVAAEAQFLSVLCEEFDEMASRMDPACADENEELINALRVISGISVNSAGGHTLAIMHPSLKELISDLLLDVEPNTTTGRQLLLLTLVCISNFTFYCFQPSAAESSAQQCDGGDDGGNIHGNMIRISSGCSTPVMDSVVILWLESLLPSLLGILFSDESSPEALLEATRALGNISRTPSGCAACRQHRIDEVVCALLIHADPRIVYNCLGIVTNLSAIAINEDTRRSALPWLKMSEEQVMALADGRCDFDAFPEVAQLAQAAKSNIMLIR